MKIIIRYTPRLLFLLFFSSTFIIVLVGVIAYARGYRFNFEDNTITSTGIIAVSSSPKAAKIYVNGQLHGATDSNLTLPYGRYTVEVKKEGYSEWKKLIALKGETVMSLDARLFSKNPTLTPLTSIGISKALLLEDGDRIIVVSQTGNEATDGIYLFEPETSSLSLFPPLTPLIMKSLLPADIDLNSLELRADPDFKQALVTFTSPASRHTYLISLAAENTSLFEVTNSKDINIVIKWDEEQQAEVKKIFESLPKKISAIALRSFIFVALSPNQQKLMYVAASDDVLPSIISPPLIGSNQMLEDRAIVKGGVYIYDEKEDKNYRQPINIDPALVDSERSILLSKQMIEMVQQKEESTISAVSQQVELISSYLISQTVKSQLLWHPTSDYVATKELNQIGLQQYDRGNKQIVYAGPFDQDFFSVSSGGKLIVIVDLNPNNNQFGDLYSIGFE